MTGVWMSLLCVAYAVGAITWFDTEAPGWRTALLWATVVLGTLGVIRQLGKPRD